MERDYLTEALSASSYERFAASLADETAAATAQREAKSCKGNAIRLASAPAK